MKILTLVRHAKSSWKEPWTSDFDRPLNGRGKRDAPEMGTRLAAAGASPSLVVSSPARRIAAVLVVIPKVTALVRFCARTTGLGTRR